MCLSVDCVLVSPPGQGWDPGLGEEQRVLWVDSHVSPRGLGLILLGSGGAFPVTWRASVPQNRKPPGLGGQPLGTPQTWPLGTMTQAGTHLPLLRIAQDPKGQASA